MSKYSGKVQVSRGSPKRSWKVISSSIVYFKFVRLLTEYLHSDCDILLDKINNIIAYTHFGYDKISKKVPQLELNMIINIYRVGTLRSPFFISHILFYIYF